MQQWEQSFVSMKPFWHTAFKTEYCILYMIVSIAFGNGTQPVAVMLHKSVITKIWFQETCVTCSSCRKLGQLIVVVLSVLYKLCVIKQFI